MDSSELQSAHNLMQQDGIVQAGSRTPLSPDADVNRGQRTERAHSEPAHQSDEEDPHIRHHYRRRSGSSCETTRATLCSNAGDSVLDNHLCACLAPWAVVSCQGWDRY